MARVLEPGRYVSQTAIEKRQRVVALALASTGGVLGFLGFLAGQALRTSPWWDIALCACGFITLLRVLFILLLRRIEASETKAPGSRKPEEGFGAVGTAIRNLPDGFQVMDGLRTPFGTVDHVVIGHSGVFVVTTKDWKGVVAADRSGELLWNGHRLDSPLIEEFSSRVSWLDESIRPLLAGQKAPIQGVLVFTAAQVDAAPGTTGQVDCIRADELHDYLLNPGRCKTLGSHGVERVGHAFLALAGMNPGGTGLSNLGPAPMLKSEALVTPPQRNSKAASPA